MATNPVLEKCVYVALRQLSKAALQALRTALQMLVVMLNEQIAMLLAKAWPLKLAAQLIQSQAVLVKSASDYFKNLGNLLPLSEVEICTKLSLINLNIADRMAPITDSLDALENDLLVLASLVSLNGIQLAAVNALKKDINDIIDAIDQIISEPIPVPPPP